ncbi:MAG: 23S rRNA (guanosine(2251)-2'-O)-methyltransferase RlmB [Clostridia bacterium]|nr:23S rRNA (guanosine(2251)-2'-O)-methyltransferase RlmB [Clostridia bacterium]
MEKKQNNRKEYGNSGRRNDHVSRRYEETDEDYGIVVGRNAVRELLKSGRPVDKLYVAGREGSVLVLIAEAKKAGIPVVDADVQKLDKLARGENHQGVAAQTAAKEYASIADILQIAADRGEMPLIVVCDGVEDPHNLGAIIRCAECCGAHGVVIPKRRACGLTPAVYKASAGAVEHMAVARVQNIAGAVEELKEAGVWTFAAEAGGQDFWDADFHIPCAIVLGSEGNGVSRLVKERCDFLVSIPMYGQVNSLNVSTAASVLLCHAARKQRG